MGAVDLTASCIVELVRGATHVYKELIVETPATANTGDTLTVDLKKFAGSKLKSIIGTIHTTANSVLVGEAPTTSVTNGVVTITLGGSAANAKIRVYKVEFT